ncbi:ferritin-like protein [Nocardioides sp. CER19]|uniref:ferritin-like domain-containing protein n=1 Tax=Nocardioides sp. CER19 TaxID=3038538 RepID=UPI00244B973C|nr:ferritin-like protein [Nocardioides sp. CER19]MDH2414430.1 ferritin-like protein [Nocardioides sp. CER19]
MNQMTSPVPLSPARIDSMESLREHLQWAIELEHATLPPYLCALYSLDPQRNRAAAEVVESIFIEEMLHLTLAANLLNAVGGSPILDSPRLLPAYPTTLPHADRSFDVELLPFGPQAIELLLRIERPSVREAAPESEGYETIGQFYAAIRAGLVDLCAELGEDAVFSGDRARQATPTVPYGGSGRIIAVDGLDSALQALDEIVEQGEGAAHRDVWDGDHDMFHPDRDEVGHYFRVLELKLGRRFQRGDTPVSGPSGEPVTVDWDGVWPMRPNPRIADHEPGSEIRVAQERFNVSYCTLLNHLEQAFNGNPGLLGAAVGEMYGLKAQAQALMQLPNEDEESTAGPTFEYVAPADRG